MIFRKVAVGEVSGAVRLIIEAVVGLRIVRDIGVVVAVDIPVHAAVIAGFKEGARDHGGGLCRQAGLLCKCQFREGSAGLLQSLVFAFPFDGKESENLVLENRTTERTAELLPCVVRVGRIPTAVTVGHLFIRVKRSVTEITEY